MSMDSHEDLPDPADEAQRKKFHDDLRAAGITPAEVWEWEDPSERDRRPETVLGLSALCWRGIWKRGGPTSTPHEDVPWDEGARRRFEDRLRAAGITPATEWEDRDDRIAVRAPRSLLDFFRRR